MVRSWMTEIGRSPRRWSNPVGRPQPNGRAMSPLVMVALSGPEWEAAVAEAVRRIGDGKLEKVVLAHPDLLAFAENDIDLRWIAGRLAEDYAQCWTYSVDGLVGATPPEMLVRREAGLATAGVGRHHPPFQ